jgi:hypothetical protein
MLCLLSPRELAGLLQRIDSCGILTRLEEMNGKAANTQAVVRDGHQPAPTLSAALAEAQL